MLFKNFILLIVLLTTSLPCNAETEGLKLKHVLPHLGIKSKDAPIELKGVIKNILKRYNAGGRDKSEFEVSLEEFRSRWEVVRDKIQTFVNSSDYRVYSDVPLALITSLGEKVFNIATVDELKSIYMIYTEQPELFKAFAKANQKNIWERFELLVGSVDQLDDGIDKFLQLSDYLEVIRNFIAPFRESRIQQIVEQQMKLINEGKSQANEEQIPASKNTKSAEKNKEKPDSMGKAEAKINKKAKKDKSEL